MEKIKGIFFDVDGTLMTPMNNTICESSKLAIQKLHDLDIDVIIATGRNHFALGYELDALNPDYIVSCCGAAVYDVKNKHLMTRHHMSLKDTQTLIDFATQHDCALLFKFDDGMYLYNRDDKIPWINPEFNKTLDPKVYVYNQHLRHLTGTLPFAAMLYCDDYLIEPLKESTHLQFIPAGANGFDIVNKDINKAVGAKDLIQVLNRHKENFMAFGDHYNDYELFASLPYCIAMGNAVQPLKDIAYDVTDDVDKDGIYKALVKHKIIQG